MSHFNFYKSNIHLVKICVEATSVRGFNENLLKAERSSVFLQGNKDEINSPAERFNRSWVSARDPVQLIVTVTLNVKEEHFSNFNFMNTTNSVKQDDVWYLLCFCRS